MHHLCPQVSCRSTWNREKRKRQRSLWHTYKSVHDGPQVRVSNDEHHLLQRQCVRTKTPTMTPYTHHCLLNKKDKYLLVRTLCWSDELDGTVGQLRSSPSPHTMAVTSTAPCYNVNHGKECQHMPSKWIHFIETLQKYIIHTSNKLGDGWPRGPRLPLRNPPLGCLSTTVGLRTGHL